MSDLRKVQPNDKLRIPAAVYNAFVDAAIDHQSRQRNTEQTPQNAHQSSGIVLVRNDSGAARARFDVLGTDAPIIGPATNENEFLRRVVLEGLVPWWPSYFTRFAILQEPLPDRGIGRAIISGVTPARVIVNSPHDRFADISPGNCNALSSARYGAAQILWKAGSSGVQWALVRLGVPAPTHAFPVNLTQVGGSQGNATTPATWTYDVVDAATGITLATNINPMAAPHKWRRPSVGYIVPATFGYAHYQVTSWSHDLVLGWINEVIDQEACET